MGSWSPMGKEEKRTSASILEGLEKEEGKGKSSGYVEGGPQKQLSRDLGVSGGMKDLCMSKTGERWKTSGDVLGHGQHHPVPSATCVHSHFGSSEAVSVRQMLHLVPPSIPNPSWMLLRAVSPPCTSTSDSGSFLRGLNLHFPREERPVSLDSCPLQNLQCPCPPHSPSR